MRFIILLILSIPLSLQANNFEILKNTPVSILEFETYKYHLQLNDIFKNSVSAKVRRVNDPTVRSSKDFYDNIDLHLSGDVSDILELNMYYSVIYNLYKIDSLANNESLSKLDKLYFNSFVLKDGKPKDDTILYYYDHFDYLFRNGQYKDVDEDIEFNPYCYNYDELKLLCGGIIETYLNDSNDQYYNGQKTFTATPYTIDMSDHIEFNVFISNESHGKCPEYKRLMCTSMRSDPFDRIRYEILN